MEAGRLIDRFGPETVYQRPMRYGEAHRIQIAEGTEAVYRAYQLAVKDKDGAAGFAQAYPDAAAAVMAARIEAYGNID